MIQFLQNRSEYIFYFLLLAVLTAIFAFHPLLNVDIWWHLKSGEWIFNNLAVPHADFFTFTFFGKEWVANGWLAEVVYYIFYLMAGNTGIVILQSAIVFALLCIVHATTQKERPFGNTIVYIVLLTIGACGASLGFFPRPHMFSTLFFVLTLFIITNKDRLRWHILWIMPVLFCIWINLHAGALLGAGILFLFYLGKLIDARFRLAKHEHYKHVMVIIFSTAALFINPYGTDLALLPIHHSIHPIIGRTAQEWLPIWRCSLKYIPVLIYYIFVTAMLIAFILRFKRLGFKWLLISLLVLAISAKHIRFIPLFILLAIPLIVRATSLPVNKPINGHAKLYVAILFLMTIAVYWFGLPITLDGFRMKPDWNLDKAPVTPKEAIDFIQEKQIKGPVLNNMPFAGYMLWRLWPDQKVYIDGRIELYDPDFYNEYTQIQKNTGVLERILERYSINYLILSAGAAASEQNIHIYLLTQGKFAPIYADKQAIIYLRNNEENKELIKSLELKDIPF